MKERIRVLKETQFAQKMWLIIQNYGNKEGINMIQMIKFLKKILGKKEALLTLNTNMNNLTKVVKVDRK